MIRTSVQSLTFRNLICVCALLLCTFLALPIYTFATGEAFPVIPEDGFAVVSRGMITSTVEQSGTVESGNNLTLTCKSDWPVRILNLVPEGTLVQAGDIVAELDASVLQNRYDERRVLLVNAEAALSQAKEDVDLQLLNNESQLANAELEVELTRLSLEGYQQAEHPQKRHESEAAVAFAEEQLKRDEKTFEFVDRMVKLGYRSQLESETERLKVLKSQQAYELAVGKLNILNKHSYGRDLIKLQADHQVAVFDLDRFKAAGRAAVLTKQIRLRSRERTYEIYREYQEQLTASIAACRIQAPKPGQVIHATISPQSSRKLEEGDTVTTLQSIVHLPDRDQMQVKLRVHESLLQRVHVGNPASVHLDALPGVELEGKVSNISKVPMPGRYPNYEVREYCVHVTLDETVKGFQEVAPGMTANVIMISGERKNTLMAPVESITKVAGRCIAFVRYGDDVQPRDVEIGLVNNDVVEILNGLEEGEELVQRPRITCAKRISAIEGRSLAHASNTSLPVQQL